MDYPTALTTAIAIVSLIATVLIAILTKKIYSAEGAR